jgi:hypothetical protein
MAYIKNGRVPIRFKAAHRITIGAFGNNGVNIPVKPKKRHNGPGYKPGKKKVIHRPGKWVPKNITTKRGVKITIKVWMYLDELAS